MLFSSPQPGLHSNASALVARMLYRRASHTHTGARHGCQHRHCGIDGCKISPPRMQEKFILNAWSGEASNHAIATPRKRAQKLPVFATGRTTLPGPTTNLNIGIDIRSPPHVGAASLKVKPNAVISTVAAGANILIVDTPWAQEDERELKREKRKKSTREFARRSRLHKQLCWGSKHPVGFCLNSLVHLV